MPQHRAGSLERARRLAPIDSLVMAEKEGAALRSRSGMNDPSPLAPVSLRLSDDAMRLEALFAPECASLSSEQLAEALRAAASRLGVSFDPSPQEAAELRRQAQPHAWLTVLRGQEPSSGRPGRVDVLVPIATAGKRPGELPRKCMVRVGAVLARLQPGTPGLPGKTLLGQPVPPRPPVDSRLPQGANTEIADDGQDLLAVCDGEAVLRSLLIEVQPAMLILGDVAAGTTQIAETVPIYVRGSVLEGALVAALGDVFVEGNVMEAHLLSSTARVTVAGTIGGTRQRAGVVRAAGDVLFDQARLARIRAGRNMHVLTRAWQSSLHARGDLYLRGTLEDCLQEVVLEIGGGVFPGLSAPLPEGGQDRESLRVGCMLKAELAAFGAPPLAFCVATVIDLSGGGARIAVSGPPATDLDAGTMVEVKFLLPQSPGQVVAIGPIARLIPGGSVGMVFQQLTARDRERITLYCQQETMKRSSPSAAARDHRVRW
jgi:hypothetical protein